MQPRMKQPALVVPEAMHALQALGELTRRSKVPARTRELIHLRASQINGCSFCVDMHSRDLKKGGETAERLWAVAAWRESPLFTDAERAVLALTEALTRIADQPDPVSDPIWSEAARHYDEAALAAIVLEIAGINLWNRLNVATRQMAAPR